MSSYPALFSDSDGTLVNTVPLIRHGQFQATVDYLTGLGIDSELIPDYKTFEEILHQTVGGLTHDTMRKNVQVLFKDRPDILGQVDFDDLYSFLQPEQDRLAPEFIKPFDRLNGLLQRLGSTETKLAIFTSGTQHHIVRNLGISLPELGHQELYLDTSRTDFEKLSIFIESVKKYFELPAFTVVAEEDTRAENIPPKSDPGIIYLAARRLGISDAELRRSMALGDHGIDMQTALNAGITTRVGITQGFGTKPELQTAGATHIVSSLVEVADLICRKS